MSTNSLIGCKTEKGKVRYIYCHSDGYITYNGVLLSEAYKDFAKVKELIDRGNCSSLGTKIINTRFYEDEPAEEMSIEDFKKDSYYHYLFDPATGDWTLFHNDKEAKLEDVLTKYDVFCDIEGETYNDPQKEFNDIEQTRLDFRNNYQLWNPDHNISNGLLQSIIDPELMCVDVMKREKIFESSKTTSVEKHVAIPFDTIEEGHEISDRIIGMSFNEIRLEYDLFSKKEKLMDRIDTGDISIDEIPDEYWVDKDVMLSLLKHMDPKRHYNAFVNLYNRGLDADLLADKDIGMEYVRFGASALQDLDPSLHDDKDVVLQAVKHHSYALKFASERLRDDNDVFLAAFRNNDEYAFLFCSDRLKQQKEIKQKCLDFFDGIAKLRSALDSIKTNARDRSRSEENMLENFNYVVYNFEDAYLPFKQDRDVMIHRIRANRDTYLGRDDLQLFADDELVAKELIAEGTQPYQVGIRYSTFSNRVKEMDEITITAMKINPSCLMDAPDRFKDDPELIASTKGMLLYASDRLKEDDEFNKHMIDVDHHNYSYANERVKKDRDVVMKVIEKGHYGALFGSENKKLREDPELCLAAIKSYVEQHPPASISQLFKEGISPKLRKNSEFMMGAIQICPHSYAYGYQICQKDPVVIEAAIEAGCPRSLFTGEALMIHTQTLKEKEVQHLNKDATKYRSNDIER